MFELSFQSVDLNLEIKNVPLGQCLWKQFKLKYEAY